MLNRNDYLFYLQMQCTNRLQDNDICLHVFMQAKHNKACKREIWYIVDHVQQHHFALDQLLYY